jgi:hypothetical protein
MPLPMWTAKNNVQLPSVTKLRYLAGRNHDPYLEENILAGKNSHRAVGNPEMEFGGKTDFCKKIGYFLAGRNQNTFEEDCFGGKK